MANNNSTEKKFYNAVNIALAGDYKKINSLKESPWEETWHKIKNNHPGINPEKEFTELEKTQVKLLLIDEPDFPSLLREIPWTPLGIYIKGSLPSLSSIAIVGTRRASNQGKATARQIAKELSQNGLRIVSGLAMGIDESAHSGALEAQATTVAVLPSGLNNIYPRQNNNLANKIVEQGGALVSEFPLTYRPLTHNFIQRNRIISALCQATVVIEAPEKSGALATARFALEQNREIFVTPGPINSFNYKGSHKLIRDGGRLVTSATEIMDDLGIENTAININQNAYDLSDEEKKILEIINQMGWPASIDKIAEASKLQIQKVNQLITFLTIKGFLK